MISEKLKSRNIETLNALELSRMIEQTIESKVNKGIFRTTEDGLSQLKKSIDLATVLHSKQTRKNRDSYKRTPYIEHPLRNTFRLIKWGVDDSDILIASVLHDTVEDSSQEYCRLFLGKKIKDEELAREHLSRFINHEFGARVESIVQNVTNEVSLESSGKDKNEKYISKVKKSIANNPEAFLVKLSDFIDNGTGLWHGDDTDFIAKQVAKYKPLVPVFIEELKMLTKRKQLDVTARGFQDIVFKLQYAEKFFDEFV